MAGKGGTRYRRGGTRPGDPPTERQADVLLMAHLLTVWLGRGPSWRELCDALLMSIGGVNCHLRALRRKGLVTWEKNKARTLRVLEGKPCDAVSAEAPV